MDPSHYGKIGTTARAEPVNNQELLFPNGYDRNQNRERPLVVVCDTAGTDEADFDDYCFDSGSPTDNVTVTIKFCNATKGIITETERRSKETNDSESGEKTQNGSAKQSNTMLAEAMPAAVQQSTDSDKTTMYRPARKTSESRNKEVTESVSADLFSKRNDENKSKINTDSVKPRNRNLQPSVQDSLYDEYERFVVPRNSEKDAVSAPSVRETETTDVKQKPVLKIKPQQKVERCKERIDRSAIVSPKCKTTIVVEAPSVSEDEPEDFMEYLKQLKGKNSSGVDETLSQSPKPVQEKQTMNKHSNGRRCDSTKQRSFTHKLVPILTVKSIQPGHATSNDDSLFSDAESDDDKNSKSLLEFNFDSLSKTKKMSGKNSFVEDDEDMIDDELTPEYNERPECMGEKDVSNPKKEKKILNEEEVEKEETSESETEESDEETNNKNNDESSESDNDSNDRNGDGSNATGGDNNDDSYMGDDDDYFSEQSDNDGDSDLYHESHESEGYFSPGMRSRSADIEDNKKIHPENKSGAENSINGKQNCVECSLPENTPVSHSHDIAIIDAISQTVFEENCRIGLAAQLLQSDNETKIKQVGKEQDNGYSQSLQGNYKSKKNRENNYVPDPTENSNSQQIITQSLSYCNALENISELEENLSNDNNQCVVIGLPSLNDGELNTEPNQLPFSANEHSVTESLSHKRNSEQSDSTNDHKKVPCVQSDKDSEHDTELNQLSLSANEDSVTQSLLHDLNSERGTVLHKQSDSANDHSAALCVQPESDSEYNTIRNQLLISADKQRVVQSSLHDSKGKHSAVPYSQFDKDREYTATLSHPSFCKNEQKATLKQVPQGNVDEHSLPSDSENESDAVLNPPSGNINEHSKALEQRAVPDLQCDNDNEQSTVQNLPSYSGSEQRAVPNLPSEADNEHRVVPNLPSGSNNKHSATTDHLSDSDSEHRAVPNLPSDDDNKYSTIPEFLFDSDSEYCAVPDFQSGRDNELSAVPNLPSDIDNEYNAVQGVPSEPLSKHRTVPTIPSDSESEYSAVPDFPSKPKNKHRTVPNLPSDGDNKYSDAPDFPSEPDDKHRTVPNLPSDNDNEYSAVSDFPSEPDNKHKTVPNLPSESKNEQCAIADFTPDSDNEHRAVPNIQCNLGKEQSAVPDFLSKSDNEHITVSNLQSDSDNEQSAIADFPSENEHRSVSNLPSEWNREHKAARDFQSGSNDNYRSVSNLPFEHSAALYFPSYNEYKHVLPFDSNSEHSALEDLPSDSENEHRAVPELLHDRGNKHSPVPNLPSESDDEHSVAPDLHPYNSNEHSAVPYLPFDSDHKHSAVPYLPSDSDSEHSAVPYLLSKNSSEYNAVLYLPSDNSSEHSTVTYLSSDSDSKHSALPYLPSDSDNEHSAGPDLPCDSSKEHRTVIDLASDSSLEHSAAPDLTSDSVNEHCAVSDLATHNDSEHISLPDLPFYRDIKHIDLPDSADDEYRASSEYNSEQRLSSDAPTIAEICLENKDMTYNEPRALSDRQSTEFQEEDLSICDASDAANYNTTSSDNTVDDVERPSSNTAVDNEFFEDVQSDNKAVSFTLQSDILNGSDQDKDKFSSTNILLHDTNEAISDENSEIMEILDYSEILNSVDCTFQTIDTYIVEEYESSPEVEGATACMPEEENVLVTFEDRIDISSPQSVIVEYSCESDGRGDSRNSLCNSDSHKLHGDNCIAKVEEANSSSVGLATQSDSPNHEVDLRFIELFEYSNLQMSTNDRTNDKHESSEQTYRDVLITGVSESSSETDPREESDFESVLEDEFWSKTIGSVSETSYDEDFSSIDSPGLSEADDVTDISSHYKEAVTDSDIPNVDLRVVGENEKNEMLKIDFEEKDDLCNSDTDSTNTTGDFESLESDYCESLDNSSFVDKIKALVLEDSHQEEIESDGKNEIKTCEKDIDEEDLRLNTNTRRLICEEKPKLSYRTISYFVPYLKVAEVKPLCTKPNKERKLRFICSARKSLLSKILPSEAPGFTCDASKETKVYEHSGVSKTNEGKDTALLNIIDDIKKKSKICNKNEAPAVVGKPGQIIKVGVGFYIFGSGEKLDLPIGPRLKCSATEDPDKDILRPSVYFRGVPGIISNACKMSNFRFPKLAVPGDTSSRKILHACNRLATQLSPLEPRHDVKQMLDNMAIEEADDTSSVSSQDLSDMLMTARDFLNSSRFDDAETSFLKLYKQIQEKPEDNGRLLVETLTGLADICIRRSRMCRSNPLEWQWLCMHAIALLQYTVEFCESELESQLDNEATEWYQEQRQASELKCRPLEDAFTRALYNCLKHDANFFDPFQSFSLPNTPVSQQKKPNLFPLSSTMPQYLLVPGMAYRVTDQGLQKQSSDDSDIAVDWLAKFQFYCKDRLQTKDHKGVTEKVLKSTKSTDNDETESILSNSSRGSLDWDNSDLNVLEEADMSIVTDKESPITDFSLEFELATSDTDNEGWDFFLHQRRNCDLQSVVQVVTEDEKAEDKERDASGEAKETQDIYQQEKSEKSRKKHHEHREIISPLHAHSISLTLARSFCRLADKLVQEEEYKKAEMVYEKILDIIDAIQDGTAGMLRFSARIMKNLGTVKSKQGKSSSGLVLLNKALNTYRDLQDEEANFEIAVALIELGNGYIVGKNHEDSVFNDVIIAICDFFEKDANDSHSTSTSSSVQSHISQMTSSLNSNPEERNVEEAVMCYTEAISLLDSYEADEKQVDMFAKAVMRLGDCHFMQKDYDKALECYEKALSMFRTYNIFGKDSLMENAHVLCMLGVSSFMLHVYPRAASVFETALHMVRCAYGFKRTFLNGMLQSLSGITYYKMKNYHKCVSMCYQGYETYCELFGESMSRLDKQKFWLVCQTLYVMGNSYNILNLQQKAVKYLTIARSLMKSSKSRERRQFMRVLQILGDCYFATYDYKTALQFYNEALEYGECESSISFDEVFDPNCASDEMTIHNHLVSKSAEAHLSMQQYQNAVHYLEQAHDMQEVMGEDIKGDLINTLHQLGQMHSVAGDVDKAIESYKECLEVFREIHKGQLGPEMCTTLGNLAAICYVKACVSDTLEEEEKTTQMADAYFQEALALETNAEVCIKYANFLYSQCNFESAIDHLKDALRNDRVISDIVYRGLEKVTLPELLQDEVDTQEEICFPSTCLARYLLILSYKAMQEMEEAELQLICLMEEVQDYDVPLLHSLLGYAMMELGLFAEAAECFRTASETEEEYQLACENYCICLLVILYQTLQAGLEHFLEYISKTNPSFRIDYSA